MLNYRADRALLEPLVPRGTELDDFLGETVVSVVGFRFLDTRLLGVPVPLHRDFEEVNLRFYVRRIVGREVRRGVVFVKELVPRAAIALVARAVYNEPYEVRAMTHSIGGGDTIRVSYAWRERTGTWGRITAETAERNPHPLAQGTEEEFITEHYWGYTRQRDGGTIEYRVDHPRWRVWSTSHASLEADVAALYGVELAPLRAGPPRSAFVAEGSRVTVHRPVRVA